jgi:single-strand DNA-binding protein
MNTVNLTGRLTSDVDLKSRKDTKVANLRLAVQRPRRNGEDQGADFVDVVTFGRQAEVCAEYLAKGRRVAIEGRLRHSEWTDDDGHRRQKLEVVANQVEFLDSKGNGSAPADEAAPSEEAAAV